jgi:dynamin 1-like protein
VPATPSRDEVVLILLTGKVLLNHIRDKLPDMKARLNTLMGQAQQELNSFGDAAIYGDANQVRN